MKQGNPSVKPIKRRHPEQAVQLDQESIFHGDSLMRQKYESVVEAPVNMICRFRPDTTLVFVNQAYCKAFGTTKERLLGRKFLELIPESEHRSILQWLQGFSWDQRIREYEHEVILPDGEKGCQVWSDTAFFDEKGQIIEFQSIGRDITQQKRTERALSETLSRLRALLAYSPVPISIFTGEGVYLDVSEATARIHGTTTDQLIGKHFSEVFSSETNTFRLAMLERLKKEGKPFVIMETKQVNAVTRTFENYLFPVESAGEGHSLFAGIAIDVTERNNAEAAIKDEQQRLRNIIAGTRAGTWERNYITGQTRYNEQYAAIIGYTLDELQPATLDSWRNYIHPEDMTVSDRLLQEYLRGERDYYECEVRMKHKDGHWVWIMDRGKFTAWTEDGEPYIMQGTHLDITHLKQTEHELRQANLEIQAAAQKAEELAARADAAGRAKSDFLANMSHEIRTPLHAIVGFSHLLKQTGLDEQQRRYLDHLQDASESLLYLVDDILDFSKMEAGRLDIELRAVDIRVLLRRIQAMFVNQADAKSVSLSLLTDPALPTYVLVDAMRLRQILVNLLSNGIKFTNRGRVEFRVSFHPTSHQKGILQFHIKDTGIGITQEQQRLLFEPFYQADASTTRQYGGTGLGLSISQKLAQLMGGSLSVDSREGEGSVFTLQLETAYWSTADTIPEKWVQRTKLPASTPAAEAIHHDPVTLLVAEDLAVNRELTRAILCEMLPQATIVEAGNGEEALRLIRKTNPHLVLMDVQMPRLDGLQVTGILRQEEQLSGGHIPVIALTAGVLPEEKTKCYASGMDDFLTKPLNYEKLKLTLAKYLKNGAIDEAGLATLTNETAARNLLGKVMNDPALFIRISSQFESDSLSLLDLMKEAVNTENSEDLIRAAHACKGILNAMEAKEAYLTASRLEDMGRQMNFTDAEKTYLQLENIIKSMISAFDAHRKQFTKLQPTEG